MCLTTTLVKWQVGNYTWPSMESVCLLLYDLTAIWRSLSYIIRRDYVGLLFSRWQACIVRLNSRNVPWFLKLDGLDYIFEIGWEGIDYLFENNGKLKYWHRESLRLWLMVVKMWFVQNGMTKKLKCFLDDCSSCASILHHASRKFFFFL